MTKIAPMTAEYALLISLWRYDGAYCVYDDVFLDIGLGLRPEMCGKNMGLSFLCKGLDFAREFYKTSNFRLTVAAFNQRAIKVYQRAGFCISQEVTHVISGGKFFVMECCEGDKGSLR